MERLEIRIVDVDHEFLQVGTYAQVMDDLSKYWQRVTVSLVFKQSR